MTAGWRALALRERKLLSQLLAPEFPGKQELIEQVGNCVVRELDADGGLEIRTNSSIRATQIKFRVRPEGEFEDTDGVTVHVLLHVLDDAAVELEVYKDDNSAHSRLVKKRFS